MTKNTLWSKKKNVAIYGPKSLTFDIFGPKKMQPLTSVKWAKVATIFEEQNWKFITGRP